MHKARAYEVLSRELQLWSLKPASELVARVGEPAYSTSAMVGTEEVQVEVVVAWAEETDRQFVLIIARALGPSHWQLQRLEESVKIRVAEAEQPRGRG